MFLQLVETIVFRLTMRTFVGFVLEVTSLMVILVAYRGEGAWTMGTLIGLLPCMDAHMYKKITPLVESSPTPHAAEETEI